MRLTRSCRALAKRSALFSFLLMNCFQFSINLSAAEKTAAEQHRFINLFFFLLNHFHLLTLMFISYLSHRIIDSFLWI